jgi:hypothetical protein
MSNEDKLVAEVKRRRPYLKTIIPIFTKYGYDIRDQVSKDIFLNNNLIKYLKKDKQLTLIHKKSAAEISLAYKEMRTLGSTRSKVRNRNRV